MKLNELRDTSYAIAQSKGWHDPKFPEPSFGDQMALVLSELAEALEEHRLGKPARDIEYVKDGVVACKYHPDEKPLTVSFEDLRHTALMLVQSGHKPCGVVVELADAMIRIGHIAGRNEIDLETKAYAATWIPEAMPPLKELVTAHETDPSSFGSWVCRIAWELACADGQDQQTSLPTRPALHLMRAAVTICRFAHWLGIPGEEFESAIEIKHAYNKTREWRHGNKLL